MTDKLRHDDDTDQTDQAVAETGNYKPLDYHHGNVSQRADNLRHQVFRAISRGESIGCSVKVTTKVRFTLTIES